LGTDHLSGGVGAGAKGLSLQPGTKGGGNQKCRLLIQPDTGDGIEGQVLLFPTKENIEKLDFGI
jgi:hypothetical protein